MKTIITTLLIFLSGSAVAEIIYRCGNSYWPEPCYGEINKLLIYTPMTQKQKKIVENARLEIENRQKLERQFELQHQKETAKITFLNAGLVAFQRIANYQQTQAVLQFKQGLGPEIWKSAKDQEDQMLDDIAWRSIEYYLDPESDYRKKRWNRLLAIRKEFSIRKELE